MNRSQSEPDNPFASPRADIAGPPDLDWYGRDVRFLGKVRVGLLLVYGGLVLVGAAFVLAAFGGMAARRRMPGGLVAIGFGALLFVAGVLLALAGTLVCLVMPRDTEAKGLLTASAVFQSLYVAWALIGPVVASGAIGSASSLVPLVPLAGQALFVLSMKRFAEYVGRFDLARRANQIFVTGCILAALGALAVAGLALEMPALGVLLIAPLIGGFIVLVLYAKLVRDLRTTLRPE